MFRTAIFFTIFALSFSAYAGFEKGDVIRIPIMEGSCTVQSVGADGSMMVKLNGEMWSQYPPIPVGPNAAKTCRLIQKASSLDKAHAIPPTDVESESHSDVAS